MFVQVIKARASDRDQARAALDRWVKELAPGASGWLGTTGGMTDDGTFIALARFESEEAARSNSDRPEQGQWWAETSSLLEGEAEFRDSVFVDVDLPGNPDQAGFVQIMQGRGSNPDRARELMNEDPDIWAKFRPDVLASVVVGHDGGAYTMALYFSSEEAAREGEAKEPPAELKATMEEMDAMSVGVPDFFDIREPWLYSAG